jgi:peptide chain release factor 2
MRAEGQAHIDRIEAALALVRQSLDWDRALRRLDELDARVQDPALWDDPKQAQAITREQKVLADAIGTVRQISAEMADAVEFVEMGEAEGDDDVVNDGLASLAALADRADADKVKALLSGEVDGNDTYLEIHAGAGGTESQDWAEMLLRMYARWAERKGFKVETVEYQAGEAAGISRPRCTSRATMPMAMPRPKAASTASSASAPTTAARAATPASARCGSTR